MGLKTVSQQPKFQLLEFQVLNRCERCSCKQFWQDKSFSHSTQSSCATVNHGSERNFARPARCSEMCAGTYWVHASDLKGIAGGKSRSVMVENSITAQSMSRMSRPTRAHGCTKSSIASTADTTPDPGDHPLPRRVLARSSASRHRGILSTSGRRCGKVSHATWHAH